jgi:chromosome segregation ATPase
MEAGANRSLGSEGQPLTPEEEALLARQEAQRSRRWAFLALFLGLLATVGAALALIFLADEANNDRTAASQGSVGELREQVRDLQEQNRTARRARSEADTAEDRSRSITERVESLESRVDEADSSADAAQRQTAESIDEVNADIRELQDDVERLERERR